MMEFFLSCFVTTQEQSEPTPDDSSFADKQTEPALRDSPSITYRQTFIQGEQRQSQTVDDHCVRRSYQCCEFECREMLYVLLRVEELVRVEESGKDLIPVISDDRRQDYHKEYR